MNGSEMVNNSDEWPNTVVAFHFINRKGLSNILNKNGFQRRFAKKGVSH